MAFKLQTSTLLVIGALCLIALGIALWSCAYIPYDWIKPRLDALSVDGDAERFTQDIYANITSRMRQISMVLILCSGIVFTVRKRLSQTINTFLQAIQTSAQELWHTHLLYLRNVFTSTDRLHLVLLLFILIFGVVFRLAFLFQAMRHDEAFTFTNYASKPLLLGLSNYSFPNNHLFHTFWVHISYLLFDNHVWSIRLPAFFAGTLLMPVAYLTIRAIYNRRAALIATPLIACSSALIEYTTNARGYAFIGLFFFLLIALIYSLRNQDNLTAWILFAIISAFGFHTVPIMLYPFGTALTWYVLSSLAGDLTINKQKAWFNTLVALTLTITLTGLLYLPVILASGVDAVIGNRFVQSGAFIGLTSALPERLLQIWTQWMRDLPPLVALILGGCALVAIAFHHRLVTYRISFVWPAMLWIFITLSIQRVLPPPRVWLYLLPLFFALIGAGLAFLLKGRLKGLTQQIAITILTIGLSIPMSLGAKQSLTQYYPYGPGTLKHAEQLTQFLQTQFQPGDRLITIATAAPLEYYFLKHNVPIEYLRRPVAESKRIFLIVLNKKYTLDQVLNTAQLPKTFGKPHLVHTYPSAQLYRIDLVPTQMADPPSKATDL